MVAGYSLGLVFRTDKVEQMALVAGMSTIRVTIVNAGQRILKSRFAVPRCTDRTPVTPLLNEVQLIFEEFQHIALIGCHGGKPPFLSVLSTNPALASAKNMPCDFSIIMSL